MAKLILALLVLCPSFAWGAPTDETVWVPYTDANGTAYQLFAQVCRPNQPGSARVVVIAHGSPANASARPTMKPLACDSETVNWFLQRGYMVVYTMRTGYGRTGGPYAEGIGHCDASEFVDAGRGTARQIAAVVDYATTLPGARPNGAIVIGHSAGGWGAMAFNAIPHPKVSAVVSMAGGRGGHVGGQPNANCRPEQLAVAAGMLASGATTPMLWLYSENDTFFSPAIASSLYAAYARAGGQAQFVQIGPFDTDGHQLFVRRGGSAIWGPLLERYLNGR